MDHLHVPRPIHVVPIHVGPETRLFELGTDFRLHVGVLVALIAEIGACSAHLFVDVEEEDAIGARQPSIWALTPGEVQPLATE
eukprot:Skav234029  [mRNA]  locus=scaffold1723:72277:75486:- [translate_table: standard]